MRVAVLKYMNLCLRVELFVWEIVNSIRGRGGTILKNDGDGGGGIR